MTSVLDALKTAKSDLQLPEGRRRELPGGGADLRVDCDGCSVTIYATDT